MVIKTSKADFEQASPYSAAMVPDQGCQVEQPLPFRKSRRESGRPSLFNAWFLAVFSVLFAGISFMDHAPAGLIAIILACASGYAAIQSLAAKEAVSDEAPRPQTTSRLFVHGQSWSVSERGLIVSSAHPQDPGTRTIAFKDIEEVVIETKGLRTEISVMGAGSRVFCRMVRPPFDDQSKSVDFANAIKERSSALVTAA